MKRKLLFNLFLGISLLMGVLMKAQCPPIESGLFQFSSQEEINAFPTLYPNCTSIQGRLIIGTSPGSTNNITDLTPLSQLIAAKGLLIQNIQGTTLNGLQHLTNITGALEVRNNSNLTDISALSGVTIVNGLDINTNNALISLNGLQNIQKVQGELSIVQNALLPNLNGLAGVTEVTDRLFIRLNSAMTTVDGITNLKKAGSLSIQANNQLVNIDGLSGLNTLTGSAAYPGLTIQLNNAISDIKGLLNLTSISNQKINVSNNLVLTSLYGLDNINDETIGGLNIKSSAQLSTCNVPSVCSYLAKGKPATISSNSVGCNSVAEVEQFCNGNTGCPTSDVTLTTQAELDAFIQQYPNCNTIEGNLFIGSSTVISDITNLGALHKIKQIVGKLTIKNTKLVNLDGLNILAQTGGNLTIEDNSLLQNVEALISLTTISSSQLVIKNNPLLISLNGLENINPQSIGHLILESSQQLSTCNVPSICEYVSKFGNSYSISGNANGCSSAEEVMEACENQLPTCPPGDIEFLSQAELDHFAFQYPKCTSISGLVRIGSIYQETDINNLSSLNNISSIVENGSSSGLVISKTQLENLMGLQKLQGIPGQLVINFNSKLQTLEGAPLLKFAGTLNIASNPVLASLNGLQGIVNTGQIAIDANNSLQDLNGLNNVETSYSIDITNNQKLTSLHGLNKLTTVFGDLRVDSNPLLNDITGLAKLGTIYNDSSFESGTGFGGRLRFFSNASLKKLTGLENLEKLGWLELSTNPELSDITALSKLTSVKGNVFIINNPKLNTLEGLHNIQEIGYVSATTGNWIGDLQIISNKTLRDLTGLNSLLLVRQGMMIKANEGLADLSGLNNLKYVGQFLEISDNENLSSVNGLNNLEEINFEKASVWTFNILHNSKLNDLSAFSKLNKIHSMVYIKDNSALTSLNGLHNIDPTTIYENVEITNNPLLAICSVPFVCNWLSNPFNDMQIYDNAPGCNDSNEIIEMCSMGVNDTEAKPMITMYPIPVIDILNIQSKNGAKIENIKIFDSSGKVIFTADANKTVLDLSTLPTGLYMITVQTSKGLHQQKIIKK